MNSTRHHESNAHAKTKNYSTFTLSCLFYVSLIICKKLQPILKNKDNELLRGQKIICFPNCRIKVKPFKTESKGGHKKLNLWGK
jgi:hypothetical protein